MSEQKPVEVAVAVARGMKGDKGEPGPPGEGMTRGARHAVIFLFVLTLALAGANLLFTSHEVNAVRTAAASAQRASASTSQLCQSGNEARAQQVGLWQFIITISKPPPHESAAQERARLAALRSFNAYLHRVFAPRDCRRLAP